ncbi:ABC transporter substrate-binding protein [Sinosporangium siamense]|uniref:Peptide ABC transporter n=1 Tax=Sinosporangium siamense TaxID=1367973 RepID=A0A919RNZ5_9ACTN|nr:ABC transporter substrate-binding protein [Sinosporangium siamense]GII95969.1 peptide ABC transporter [Sinosporangium siamense]
MKGGSLTYAADTEPVSFDIHVSPQDITGAIQRNVFDSLISQDTAGEFHPWLASSWEIAKDLKSYTFTLREDVKFTDGTAFDAEAVKVNFDRIADPKTKSQLAASLLGPYAGSDVLGTHKIKVRFKEPFAPFLQAASTAYLGFYSPKAIKASGAVFGAGGPAQVGTGPFVVESYSKGQSLVLKRNPAYVWPPKTSANAGPAHLDKLTIRFLPEASVRVGALNSGQIDLAAAVQPTDIKAVEANPALKLLRSDHPGGNYSLYLNVSKAPFSDEKVRKAVQHALNVDLNVKSLYFGQYKRAWSPLSPSTPGYDASLENSVPHDPVKAGKLLDEAGWTARDSEGYRTKDGKRLVVEWPLLPAQYVRDQRNILGQAFQAELKKVGIQANRPQNDIGTYTAQVYGGKADIADYSWGRFEPDVLWLLFNSANHATKGGQNATFAKDADIDSWTNAGRKTLDREVRAELYGKVQKRVIDLALAIPIYTGTNALGYGKHVEGLVTDANTWPSFHNVWTTKR